MRLHRRPLFFLALVLLTVASRAAAYPNYISYGYQSCMACHYNPLGNGPLTDYGRALSATEISDRILWPKQASEEEIADSSGFFGRASSWDWLRPALNYRGLALRRNAGKKSSRDDFHHMDASVSMAIKLLERDRLILVGQLAYAPKPLVLADAKGVKEYRSREHYLGFRLTKEMGIYGGLMDKAFGLRLPDHVAFSRTLTGLTQNDQTHGLLLHYVSPKVEVGVHGFVGNLVQKAKLRQKGASTQIEFGLGNFTRVGGSFARSTSDYVKTLMYAGHGRFGFERGHSLLVEVGEVAKTILESRPQRESRSLYAFTQAQLRARRGLSAILTTEAAQPERSVKAQVYRIGPGLQYFPMQRLELRTDAYHTQRKARGSKVQSSWDLTAQIHLWL